MSIIKHFSWMSVFPFLMTQKYVAVVDGFCTGIVHLLDEPCTNLTQFYWSGPVIHTSLCWKIKRPASGSPVDTDLDSVNASKKAQHQTLLQDNASGGCHGQWTCRLQAVRRGGARGLINSRALHCHGLCPKRAVVVVQRHGCVTGFHQGGPRTERLHPLLQTERVPASTNSGRSDTCSSRSSSSRAGVGGCMKDCMGQ